jgi:hypothetical protein
VVLAQIQHDVPQRYLHEQRQVRLEAVLKVDLEAEKPDVEFPGFAAIEDSQRGDGPRKPWCHGVPCRLTKALVVRRF